MVVVWFGRGYWVVLIIALAMFLPIILLRQVDGPEVDRGVALAMGLAAVATLWLGLRWNAGATFSAAARRHSFFGIPVQVWALPMALFATLLGTGIITTAEGPDTPSPTSHIVEGVDR